MTIMTEQHEQLLKNMLGCETLPEAVVLKYEQLKKMADRVSLPITVHTLLIIAGTEQAVAAPKKQPVVTGKPCTFFLEGKTINGYLLEDQKASKDGHVVVTSGGITYEVPEDNVKLK